MIPPETKAATLTPPSHGLYLPPLCMQTQASHCFPPCYVTGTPSAAAPAPPRSSQISLLDRVQYGGTVSRPPAPRDPQSDLPTVAHHTAQLLGAGEAQRTTPVDFPQRIVVVIVTGCDSRIIANVTKTALYWRIYEKKVVSLTKLQVSRWQPESGPPVSSRELREDRPPCPEVVVEREELSKPEETEKKRETPRDPRGCCIGGPDDWRRAQRRH